MYQVPLIKIIDKDSELYHLSEQVNWHEFEHIKNEFRMIVNYLRRTQGDAINTLLAATGFNMMKMIKRIKAQTKAMNRYLYGTLVYKTSIKHEAEKTNGFFRLNYLIIYN